MCIALTTQNTICLLAPKFEYCQIHANMRIKAMNKKIKDQRSELTILNERCQKLAQKLKIINRIDYLKSRLKPLCYNRGYRSVINDYDYCRQVEAIFNKPFNECIVEYDLLLQKRNDIVHPYQKKTWEEKPYRRMIHNKSLTELAVFAC